MKKIIIPALLAVATLFSACSESLLDIEQKGVVDVDSFYKTDADAEAALVAAYQGFLWNICTKEGGSIYAPIHAVFNLCGDDMYAAGESFGDNDFMGAMNEFRYDTGSEVVRNAFQNIYYAMYYANLVIDRVKDADSKTKKRCVAEARVLRAYEHLLLAIGWNCPPRIDHVLAITDLPYNCDKDPENPMTHNELLEWIAKECDDAEADLDARESLTDKKGAVKVTKGFANAVAGKARLFAGDYAGAKASLEKVIKSEKYKLVPPERFAENFHASGDANEEKIFEANLQTADGISVWWDIVNRSTWMEANIWNWRGDHFKVSPSVAYSSIDGWGGCGVPQEFGDEFYANDGDSPRFKASLISIEDVVYNLNYPAVVDKKTGKAWADMTLEDKKQCAEIGIDNRGLYGQSTWLPLKPICTPEDLVGPGQNIRVNNFVIMRYAEVLLMYAEACLQTGDTQGAKDAINLVQKHAGSATISDTVDMEVLEREKKFELWLEGCRWADMVRWGHFDGVKTAGQHVPSLYDAMSKDGESAHRFYTVYSYPSMEIRQTETGFKAGKHEYFPYPEAETSLNPNLTQNPGWE